MLINIEAIDCSGKSLYSKMLQVKLDLLLDKKWIYEHEPRFSSSDADSLNFGNLDKWQREYYFMKDRMEHQVTLRNHNVVLDRYILSGLAYAQVFSPDVVPMMKSIYSNSKEFIYPDLIVFIDMDPINAMAINISRKNTEEFNPKLNLPTLQNLQQAFLTHLKTMQEWEIPVVSIIPYFGDIHRTFNDIFESVKQYL
jgi:thymidylate kinase